MSDYFRFSRGFAFHISTVFPSITQLLPPCAYKQKEGERQQKFAARNGIIICAGRAGYVTHAGKRGSAATLDSHHHHHRLCLRTFSPVPTYSHHSSPHTRRFPSHPRPLLRRLKPFSLPLPPLLLFGFSIFSLAHLLHPPFHLTTLSAAPPHYRRAFRALHELAVHPHLSPPGPAPVSKQSDAPVQPVPSLEFLHLRSFAFRRLFVSCPSNRN